MEIKDVKNFISNIEKINKIFKNIYNSEDKFSNMWNCKNGKLYMYHEKQFPSYVEIEIDSSSLVTAKGTKTKAGLVLDEFLDTLSETHFSIDSLKLFSFLKDYKKDVEKVLIEEDEIRFIAKDKIYVEPYKEMREISLLDDNFIQAFECSQDIIDNIIDFNNTPFNLTLDMDNTEIKLNDDVTKLESFISVKLNKKFLPYLKKSKEKEITSLNVELYSTNIEYMYDIKFTVSIKNITVSSLIRILEY